MKLQDRLFIAWFNYEAVEHVGIGFPPLLVTDVALHNFDNSRICKVVFNALFVPLILGLTVEGHIESEDEVNSPHLLTLESTFRVVNHFCNAQFHNSN